MHLTSGFIVLKNDILLDPVLSSYPNNPDGNDLIAKAYNLNASPDFYVWKTRLTLEEILKSPGFDWLQVDNLSVGRARIFEWMFDNNDQSINPSIDTIRLGIAEAWKGTAAMLAVQSFIIDLCKRKATRAEKLLSNIATSNGAFASPAYLTFEGQLDYIDVERARNS